MFFRQNKQERFYFDKGNIRRHKMITDREFIRIVNYVKYHYGIDLSQKRTLVAGRLENYLVRNGYSGYDEYITENKSTLGVDLKIKNNSDTSTVITPCLALYEDGNLLKTKVLSQQTISAGSEVYYNESININSYNTEIYTVKVFNWEEGNLKPLNKSIEISGNKSDFYGNSVTTAILIQDLEK